jgi:hypothetical protein
LGEKGLSRGETRRINSLGKISAKNRFENQAAKKQGKDKGLIMETRQGFGIGSGLNTMRSMLGSFYRRACCPEKIKISRPVPGLKSRQRKMKTLNELHDAAEKINAYAAQFCGRSQFNHRRAAPDATLAGVSACVCDEGGSIERGQSPEGDVRLSVDIEFFRENGRTHTATGRAELRAAEASEDSVISFCKGLGFEVDWQSNSGSGEYGPINTLQLK